MVKKLFKALILLLILAFLVFKYVIPKYNEYVSWETSLEKYRNLSHSNVHWQANGYSVLGNPIFEAVFGDSGQTTLIVAGIHGNENGSFELISRFGDYLAANLDKIKKRAIIIPVLNPDGLMVKTRSNANRVDLNRNFPSSNWTPVYESEYNHPGTEPLSEKESNFLVSVIAKYKPQKLITVHSDLETNIYYGPGKNLANVIARFNGYNVEHHRKYTANGSLGEYTGEDLNIPTVAIELPPFDPEQSWLDNREALIAAINY